MPVGGILWGRRPKHLASFRRFLIANGISATLQERVSLGSLLEGLRADIGTVLILVQLVNARYGGIGAGGSFWGQFGRALVEEWELFQKFLTGLAYL